MSEQERNQELDHLLDSLLTEYSDVEPRPGLETRLVANLRAAQSAGNHRVWHWLLAGAGAVAVIAAVLVVYVSQIPPLPELPAIRAAGLPALPPVPASGGKFGMRGARPRHESGRASVAGVRQEFFPTPTPLSDQERLLLRYLTETPREELVALSQEDAPTGGTEPFGVRLQQFTGTEGQKIR